MSRLCVWCGNWLPETFRIHARYCSPGCRVAASIRRHQLEVAIRQAFPDVTTFELEMAMWPLGADSLDLDPA
jgi:hypothetical protein